MNAESAVADDNFDHNDTSETSTDEPTNGSTVATAADHTGQASPTGNAHPGEANAPSLLQTAIGITRARPKEYVDCEMVFGEPHKDLAENTYTVKLLTECAYTFAADAESEIEWDIEEKIAHTALGCGTKMAKMKLIDITIDHLAHKVTERWTDQKNFDRLKKLVVAARAAGKHLPKH